MGDIAALLPPVTLAPPNSHDPLSLLFKLLDLSIAWRPILMETRRDEQLDRQRNGRLLMS
jgi:hypothetical protein